MKKTAIKILTMLLVLCTMLTIYPTSMAKVEASKLIDRDLRYRPDVTIKCTDEKSLTDKKIAQAHKALMKGKSLSVTFNTKKTTKSKFLKAFNKKLGAYNGLGIGAYNDYNYKDCIYMVNGGYYEERLKGIKNIVERGYAAVKDELSEESSAVYEPDEPDAIENSLIWQKQYAKLLERYETLGFGNLNEREKILIISEGFESYCHDKFEYTEEKHTEDPWDKLANNKKQYGVCRHYAYVSGSIFSTLGIHGKSIGSEGHIANIIMTKINGKMVNFSYSDNGGAPEPSTYKYYLYKVNGSLINPYGIAIRNKDVAYGKIDSIDKW